MPKTQRKLIVLSLKWYDVRIHQGVLDYAKEHDWDVVASPHESVALEIPEADGQIVMIGPSDARRLSLRDTPFERTCGCYQRLQDRRLLSAIVEHCLSSVAE